MSLPELMGIASAPIRSGSSPLRDRLRRLLARYRSLGRQPHALGEEADELWVDLLASAKEGEPVESFARRWPGADFQRGVPAPSSQPEPELELGQLDFPTGQTARLGINKGKFPAKATGDPVADPERMEESAARYGWFYQVLCDIAAAGGTVTRQLGYCELTWQWVFDMGEAEGDGDDEPVAYDPIPPPSEIYRRLIEEGDAYLVRFNLMMLACVAYGTRIVPTLFTYDGGSELNDRQTDAGGDTEVNPAAGDDIEYSEIREISPYGPEGRGGVIVPAKGGWDPFYWDPAELPVLAAAPTRALHARDELQRFQKYCLNVYTWPDHEDNPYMQECARRKALALAAFGLAVGEHLAYWDTVLAGIGSSLSQVVSYLELGNEMSVHWGVDDDASPAYSTGTYELGRFMALLAGGVWSRCPQVRFSAPGVASWGNPARETWANRVEWVRRAIVLGMPAELAFWDRVREGMSLSAGTLSDAVDRAIWEAENPAALAWLATCEAAGFTAWPPPLDSGSIPLPCLLHHANMHWFHANDRAADGGDNVLYADDSRYLEDIEVFRTKLTNNVVGTSTTSGTSLTLSWSLHPGGFPAAQPDSASPASGWSSFAGPLSQAGMLVRLLVLPLAKGAELASWHTHLAGIQTRSGAGWSQYSVMGLREDLADGSPADFRAARDAWRRPSWYAFRRLAALLARTDTVQLALAEDGLYVVCLESTRGFRNAPETTLPLAPLGTSRTWSRAFIAWLDQGEATGRESASFRLFDPAGSGVERVSLAPRVTTPEGWPGTDGCGFPTREEVAWEWSLTGGGPAGRPSPWTSSLGDWTSVADVWAAHGAIEATVYRASRVRCPVPLCLLTDATLSASTQPDPQFDRASSFWASAMPPGMGDASTGRRRAGASTSQRASCWSQR